MEGKLIYRYSAPEREEAERIRRRYIDGDVSAETPIEELRRLDRAVSRSTRAWGVGVGVMGVLVLGTGMSMVMTGGGVLLAPGIAVGVAGLVIAACARPVAMWARKRAGNRCSARILELTDELLEV